jgi:hypothetical protein
MTQVYFVMPAHIYCRRVVYDYAHHFEGVDGYIFALFVIGKGCPSDDLGRVFEEPPEFHIGAPAAP